MSTSLVGAAIGVNYGLQGDNLPPPGSVINLYKQENIPLLRLFEPNHEALEALRGTGIKVALGVINDDVPNIASDLNVANQWVATNVVPYKDDVIFGWIALGNEIVPAVASSSIPGAMQNIQQALNSVGLTGIKVTTVVNTAVLGASYPPSAGEFNDASSGFMKGIINWLQSTNNPLLVTLYPYMAYASDPVNISLGYAQFNPENPIIDGQFKYYSLFEAMVDAFYAALEKNGGPNVPLVVAETGWPTAGNDPYTSVSNAQTYNQNLINKMKNVGTPKRGSSILDIFIFAMFNENQKPAGVEQNWGIHYPTMEPVYPLTF
ncbi:glucan endo-1,3-beta-glucosidase-like [Silene latifolia]|uniref:glucan endo-1,3-beta-glucosidase-like n=1 Tax=Silene latifolia TaxID=37657 RepID=UPI003D777737